MKENGDRGAETPAGDEVVALERKLAEEEKKSDELLTRLKYAQADLENYRKRADKEMREAGESLARSLLAKLIVVQDELELASKHLEGGESKELKEGIEMVTRNLEAALGSVGMERIAAVGKPFVPSVHEAVEKTQGSSTEDVVVEEIRPGFTFRGQLLRPSMVKVELASKPAQEEKEVEQR